VAFALSVYIFHYDPPFQRRACPQHSRGLYCYRATKAAAARGVRVLVRLRDIFTDRVCCCIPEAIRQSSWPCPQLGFLLATVPRKLPAGVIFWEPWLSQCKRALPDHLTCGETPLPSGRAFSDLSSDHPCFSSHIKDPSETLTPTESNSNLRSECPPLLQGIPARKQCPGAFFVLVPAVRDRPTAFRYRRCVAVVIRRLSVTCADQGDPPETRNACLLLSAYPVWRLMHGFTCQPSTFDLHRNFTTASKRLAR
jgi:hypothetical protein